MLGSSSTISRIFGLGTAAFLVMAIPAGAEDVTEAQILKALSPPKTRSLSIGAPTQAASPDKAFVDSLRNRPTR